MDRNLTLEAVRLTESPAIQAGRLMGRGDGEAARNAAVDAMARVFQSLEIQTRIMVTTDCGDSALSEGILTGPDGGQEIDVALKALDGLNTCARGGYNAVSIVALGRPGAFQSLPCCLMEKIAVGKDVRNVVDINEPPEININRVARAKEKYVEDLTVCVLDNEMNRDLVSRIRQTGARIRYISDGEISGTISAAWTGGPVDIMMGVGGAKEGILSASAIKCLDGNMQARLVFRDSRERDRAREAGHGDDKRVYTISDLILQEDVIVSVTGVTDGVLLPGVRFFSGGAETHSVVLRYKTHTIRSINAVHYFDYKPIF